MRFISKAGSASAIAFVLAVTAGCGGGGSAAPFVPAGTSATVEGVSGGRALSAPTVSAATIDGAGQSRVNISDPATGETLSDVIVPGRSDLQPRTGQPVLIMDAAQLNLGVTFAAGRAEAAVSTASFNEGDTTDEKNELMRVGLSAQGKLTDSAALGATDGTFTVAFKNVVSSIWA